MGVRFEHELMTDPFNLGEPVYGSRLVACYTLDDPKYRLTDRRTDHDSFEEGTSASRQIPRACLYLITMQSFSIRSYSKS